ncbi:MAG: hypothetical protein AB8I08_02255 [Sandaracinaceae bacterium]
MPLKRASLLPLLLMSALGCAEIPELVATGESESPCRTDMDCVSGLFCIEVDGNAFCTLGCQDTDDCAEGYACDDGSGVCEPERSGECRSEGSRCGPSFAGCCDGAECVQLSPHGQFCARACGGGCRNGLCCAPTPGGGVCVPPLYCE